MVHPILETGAADAPAFVIVDGQIIDTETGEAVGAVDAATDAFTVDSMGALEWVLERMTEADTETLALMTRKEAYVKNMDKMIARSNARRRFLEWRFGPEIKAFAKAQLEGGKAKTLFTPFGDVAFRSSGDRIVVADKDAALAWAETHNVQAVVTTKTFQISKVPKGQIERWIELGRAGLTEEGIAKAFALVEGCETMKIDTGVFKKDKKESKTEEQTHDD